MKGLEDLLDSLSKQESKMKEEDDLMADDADTEVSVPSAFHS